MWETLHSVMVSQESGHVYANVIAALTPAITAFAWGACHGGTSAAQGAVLCVGPTQPVDARRFSSDSVLREG